MLLRIVVLTLFAVVMVADAETDDERLAKKFSPILILTEDTESDYGEDRGIRILKPEPVEIMGAHSADSIWVNIYDSAASLVTSGRFGKLIESGVLDPSEVRSHQQAWNSDFLGNKWAFLTESEFSYRVLSTTKGKLFPGVYVLKIYLDYPGITPEKWNDTYEGSGPYAGENFPNTAYVHIYKRKISAYTDSVTVIQYKYFYPYNDWWNNHEGDWQGIDVVVSSDDPNTATALGVEYRFHSVWVSYYKDWGSNPGLTHSFVFNPQNSVRLSPGPKRDGIVQYTHPVVYVGAGSHAGFPVGGKINVFNALEIIGDRIPGLSESESEAKDSGSNEYMTHTGKVLSTQADYSDTSLWEPYTLQLLPEPDLADINNMGLDPDMSWLGARIRWGTPSVNSAFVSENPLSPGNISPEKGPYNSNSEDWGESKGWGELGLFDVASKVGDPFKHKDLPKGDYHHWAIIGEETWRGTVSLYGDVVVFPGSKLTIEPGTVVTFPATVNVGENFVHEDRHKFSAPGSSDLVDVFVYGTLESKGTGSSFISFGGAAVAHYAYRQREGTGSGSSWSAPLAGGGSARRLTPYLDNVLACWSVPSDLLGDPAPTANRIEGGP